MYSFGRREFILKLIEYASNWQPALIQVLAKPNNSFCWCNLKTGQVYAETNSAFPSIGLPGSLFKLIISSVLLQENLISLNQSFECRGSFRMGKQIYTCQFPHGKLTLPEALGHSCNIFFVQASKNLSFENLLKYLNLYGLQSSLFGYSQAILTEKFKSAYNPDYILGLEKNLEVNSLQILRLASSIALRGQNFKLNYKSLNENISKIQLSNLVWNTLAQGMQMSGRIGTAKKLDINNKLRLAVKTGTIPHGQKFESWVAGYFPYNKPKYSFCLWSGKGTSREGAIPLAHEKLFSHNWIF